MMLSVSKYRTCSFSRPKYLYNSKRAHDVVKLAIKNVVFIAWNDLFYSFTDINFYYIISANSYVVNVVTNIFYYCI